MITEQEAQDLMNKLILLRNKAKENNSASIKSELKRHENKCVEKFKYLITMRTYHYKAFSNYDDLNQEGFEALVKAMNNYNPKLGSFFWWAHKYIDTRISRSANLHTAIRYPLKVAKENIPHKESVMPLLVEENYCPDKEFELSQTHQIVYNLLDKLPEEQKNVVDLIYGISGDKSCSINKVCNNLGISRTACLKLYDEAILNMQKAVNIQNTSL